MSAEDLGYNSSSPLLATAPAPVKAADENELPTLKRVQKILADQIASYSTIARLTVDEKDLTLKEQLAVNKTIEIHLAEVKLLVDTAILSVKEKYE